MLAVIQPTSGFYRVISLLGQVDEDVTALWYDEGPA
jgi:hypothetical protein